jgi:hypothetical protein
MFIIRAIFWSTIVLMLVPHNGPLALPAAPDGSTQVLDQMRADVLADLTRVKHELADDPQKGAGLTTL